MVTITDNSPSQDYTHPDNQTTLLHILYTSYGSYKENLCNNQEHLEFVIISFTLITIMFDLGMIL